MHHIDDYSMLSYHTRGAVLQIIRFQCIVLISLAISDKSQMNEVPYIIYLYIIYSDNNSTSSCLNTHASLGVLLCTRFHREYEVLLDGSLV